MPPVQITGLIGMRGDTLREAAAAIDETEPRASETISRGRRNERVRIKLCLYFNLSYETLWGGEPKWRQVTATLHERYEERFGAADSGARELATA